MGLKNVKNRLTYTEIVTFCHKTIAKMEDKIKNTKPNLKKITEKKNNETLKKL